MLCTFLTYDFLPSLPMISLALNLLKDVNYYISLLKSLPSAFQLNSSESVKTTSWSDIMNLIIFDDFAFFALADYIVKCSFDMVAFD